MFNKIYNLKVYIILFLKKNFDEINNKIMKNYFKNNIYKFD